MSKIFCKCLKKEFTSKATMFASLKANKQLIVDAKKLAIKNSDPVALAALSFIRSGVTIKDDAVSPKELGYGDYIYPVINSCWYLDTHQDVHIPKLWNKSIPDQKGKVYYIINHDLELGKVISYPNEVEMMVRDMLWTDLGKTYEGKTEVLIFKAKVTEKSNKDAYLAFKDGVSIQNSVRMIYVMMELCINSDSIDFVQEKFSFDKYLPNIVNKEKAIEDGYFWAVTEAKIYKEGSAVLFGSNDATGILYSEPQKHSQGQAADKALAKKGILEALTNLSTQIEKK